MFCKGAGQAIRMEGLAQMPIHDITIEDSYFIADKGYTESFTKDITFKNVRIEGKA